LPLQEAARTIVLCLWFGLGHFESYARKGLFSALLMGLDTLSLNLYYDGTLRGETQAGKLRLLCWACLAEYIKEEKYK